MKKVSSGAGLLAQRLRGLATPSETLSLVLSSQTLTLILGTWRPLVASAGTYTCVHAHINTNLKEIVKRETPEWADKQ